MRSVVLELLLSRQWGIFSTPLMTNLKWLAALSRSCQKIVFIQVWSLIASFRILCIYYFQIIAWLAKYKSNSLKKHKLIIPILPIMCPLLTEVTNSYEDEDLSPDRAAEEVRDPMSVELPKDVFPPVFEFGSECS